MERPSTGRLSERPTSHWRRDQNDETSRSTTEIVATGEKPTTSAGRPQTRIERPVSRRGLQTGARETSAHNSSQRATTPARNALARPPSASAYSQRIMTANSRLNTMSSGSTLSRINTGLPSTAQMNMNVLDRPITQQGIAGLRPGTTRGLPMTRQIQDKRYYEGLVQLKIRELTQEIVTITREIDSQNKERATFMHYDNRAKELASELTELQGQLADYNIVIDKTTSNIEEHEMEIETKEMSQQNDRLSLEIDNLYEQRRYKEKQLRDVEEMIEIEQKNSTKIIETMDKENREKYDKLNNEKFHLDNEINKMQKEIDFLSGEKINLEEQIALSQIKQEAVKLRVKLVEIEAKRDRLKEEQKTKLSPDEERERLLVKVKQDNMEIAAAERRIDDAEKQISELEQELEQLEADLEDSNSEKQMKYKELRKREEAMEQFMPTFEQNKKEEMEKLKNLEDNVVERLEELSYAIDNDSRLTPSEELALLKVQTSNENSDQSFEGLSKEHARLQQILTKMETLEKRLKNEFDELNEKITKRQNELIVLEDLDGLKARSELKYEELINERDELKNRQPHCREELEITKKEYNEIKEKMDKNETYVQINALEGKLDKLKESNKTIEDFVNESRNNVNYTILKEKAFNLLSRYNVVLRETVKSIY